MDDLKIIELYFDRNEQAVAETSAKYGGYCFSVADNILHSREDSEECVNDTLQRAWDSIPPTRPNVLSAFLAKITRGLAFNRYNFLRRQKRGGDSTELLLSELSEAVPYRGSVEGEFDRAQLSALIDGFLGEQPKLHSALFVGRYFFCRSVKELKAATGYSESKITSILFRMRKKLRERLEREGCV